GYTVANNLMTGKPGVLAMGSSGTKPTLIRHNRVTGSPIYASDENVRVIAHGVTIEENFFDDAPIKFGSTGHSDIRIANNELIHGRGSIFVNETASANSTTPRTRHVEILDNVSSGPASAAILVHNVDGALVQNNVVTDGQSNGILVAGDG